MGTGNAPGAHTTSLSWTQTATAGDDVFAYIYVRSAGTYPNVTAITYGGQSMTQLGMLDIGASNNGGWLGLFHLAGAPGSAQTVSVAFDQSQYSNGNSVSYKNVGSISAVNTTTSAAQSLTNVHGGMLLQAFGDQATLSSPTGGTVRYNANAASFAALIIQDSPAASANFTATSSDGQIAGMGVVLHSR